jgi:hypothetical protein
MWLPSFQAAPRHQNRLATQFNANDMGMPRTQFAWRKSLQRSAVGGQVGKVVVTRPVVRIKRLKSNCRLGSEQGQQRPHVPTISVRLSKVSVAL